MRAAFRLAPRLCACLVLALLLSVTAAWPEGEDAAATTEQEAEESPLHVPEGPQILGYEKAFIMVPTWDLSPCTWNVHSGSNHFQAVNDTDGFDLPEETWNFISKPGNQGPPVREDNYTIEIKPQGYFYPDHSGVMVRVIAKVGQQGATGLINAELRFADKICPRLPKTPVDKRLKVTNRQWKYLRCGNWPGEWTTKELDIARMWLEGTYSGNKALQVDEACAWFYE